MATGRESELADTGEESDDQPIIFSTRTKWVKQSSERSNLTRRLRQQEFIDAAAGIPTRGSIPAPSIEIRNYLDIQDKLSQDGSKQNWVRNPEFPDKSELHLAPGQFVELFPNKVDKARSQDKYLKVLYHLMREDAVGPLREAVDSVRDGVDEDKKNTFSTYEKVHISGFTFAQSGIAARIKFLPKTTYAISWESSKRLVSGSVVALSPANDRFNTICITAVIAARPLSLLQQSPPEIDIYFSKSCEIDIDPQKAWVMVESRTGYYEAHRHTMKALQKMTQESFPMKQFICDISVELDHPKYLQRSPFANLSCAIPTGRDLLYKKMDIMASWPEPPSGHIDLAQWEALGRILTKNLALIQGPPGTGKTWVSKIALQILSLGRKEHEGTPPIIVAAQTNHALDQLLCHIAEFEPAYVRLGGRSTNPDVKERTLFEVRKSTPIQSLPTTTLNQARRRLKTAARGLADLLSPLAESTETFSLDVLCKHGALSEDQKESLITSASRWVAVEDLKDDPIQTWLGDALVKFSVKYERDPFQGVRFEDQDPEYEQLRELEEETGIADDEDIELLKGTRCLIFDGVTVRDFTAKDLKETERVIQINENLWNTIPDHLRGAAYAIIRKKFYRNLQQKFNALIREYDQAVREIQIGKWERDAVILRSAPIIGMTTTGLSKYRPLIACLKPKIILIEEAAEVIEPPVTVACVESLEHLILVGDHQQLRGQCAIKLLERAPYNLDISLFERLLLNNFPYSILTSQRRMEPEFRAVLNTFYHNLEDHESVLARPMPNWGTGRHKRVFFSSEWPEYTDSTSSFYNPEEAKFIAGFYQYLVKNGFDHKYITVLTFYNGQRKQILREIRSKMNLTKQYHNVKTVDSYQGEENQIVILSLVRSNEAGKVGFLEIENRVIVALSRAKYGFFIFGNAPFLAQTSRLWRTLLKRMSADVLNHLPAICKNHQSLTQIRHPDEWDTLDGGCDRPCGERLPCGHLCKLKCHPYPHEDKNLMPPCLDLCDKMLFFGHKCTKGCNEPCSCTCKPTTNPTQGRFGQQDRRDMNDSYGSSGSRSQVGMPHLEYYDSTINDHPQLRANTTRPIPSPAPIHWPTLGLARSVAHRTGSVTPIVMPSQVYSRPTTNQNLPFTATTLTHSITIPRSQNSTVHPHRQPRNVPANTNARESMIRPNRQPAPSTNHQTETSQITLRGGRTRFTEFYTAGPVNTGTGPTSIDQPSTTTTTTATPIGPDTMPGTNMAMNRTDHELSRNAQATTTSTDLLIDLESDSENEAI